MKRAGLALVLSAGLSGCGAALSLVGRAALPDPPGIAANVQAGQTNAQTLGATRIAPQRISRPQARSIEQSSGETAVRGERVEAVTINNALPWYWIAALALAVPSPVQMLWAWRRRA